MVSVYAEQFERGARWIDAGLQAASEARSPLGNYATVALSDNVLRGIDPFQNELLNTISSQIASRPALAGVYLVVEQGSEAGYVCNSEATLLSLLLLVDDLVRGCNKTVIVNYSGAFGVAASAAGATLWASGYYVGQRRLKLSDMDDKSGRAMPRYYSMPLAGDFGLDVIEDALAQGLLGRVMTDTPPSTNLRRSLEAHTFPRTAPEWEFRQSNVTAAAAHYNWVMKDIGAYTDGLIAQQRISRVRRWLGSAVYVV